MHAAPAGLLKACRVGDGGAAAARAARRLAEHLTAAALACVLYAIGKRERHDVAAAVCGKQASEGLDGALPLDTLEGPFVAGLIDNAAGHEHDHFASLRLKVWKDAPG